MQGVTEKPRAGWGAAKAEGSRALPEERAVALSFNGTTQAVMMATPADLEDFARGFALTEGIASPAEIEEITVVEGARGFDVQTWLSSPAEERLKARRRTMMGPVGCGLCGIDSIEQALRDLAPITTDALRLGADEVMAAIAALPDHQPLHDRSRAVHCAAFWAEGAIRAAREDVGRHNALDKLIGHRLTQAQPAAGAVVLTSRVSIDMVQKVVALGAEVLIAVSAPTADAVALADSLGLTVIGHARPDRFEVYTHTRRVIASAPLA